MKELLYKIEAVNEISGQLFFTCRLIEKEADTQHPEIKFLKSKASGFRWKVGGATFLPAKAMKKGIRLIPVEPLLADAHVSVGETLIGEF